MSEAENSQGKILRFNADTSSPTHTASNKAKYQFTGKYNRIALNKRIALEGWIDSELRSLFDCKDDESYDVEIDIDILLEQEDNETCTNMLQKLLKDAKKPVEEFIKELLIRMQELDKNIRGTAVETKEPSISC